MRSKIVSEILSERDRQDKKWGEQNHHPFIWNNILGEETGEAQKASLEAHFGNKSWEEFRIEIIQVAAVAVAMIECFDRGKWLRTKAIDPNSTKLEDLSHEK